MISFFKQFLVYGFSSVLAKVAAVFLMPFYTNILSKDEYGAMAVVIACKGIIDLFSNLNIHSGIARDFYETKNKRTLVSTGFYSIFGVSLIVFFFLFFSKEIWVYSVLKIPKHETAFFYMLLSIPAGSLMSYFGIITRYNQKPITYSFCSLFQLIVQIVTSVYLVLKMNLGIDGIFIGILVSETCTLIILMISNRYFLKLSFSVCFFRSALKYALPTLPAILAGWIDSSLGQIMIGKYVSMKDVAIYSVALQLVSVFTLLYTALSNVLSPYLFENYKKKSFTYEILFLYKIIVYVSIFMTVNISLLSKDLIVILSNESYIDSSRFLTILCFPFGLYLLLTIVGCGIFISRKTIYLSYSYISGSIINLVMLFCLLPIYGIIIVPLALVISRLVNYIVLRMLNKRTIEINFKLTPVIIMGMVTIVCYYINVVFDNQLYVRIILVIFDIVVVLALIMKYWKQKKCCINM